MQWSSLQKAHGRPSRLERSQGTQPVAPTLPVQGGRGAEPVDDRRVDLAAAHATPELLAIRDRLLVALAFSSGVFEAICFLSFGKVFTAFQTGNLVFLGLGVAGTRPPDGPDPVRVVISLAAFAVGAALATRILTAFNGDEEMEDSEIFEAWPRRVSIALCVATVAQVGFLVVWMATSPSSLVSNILVALNAFAMGLQMNAIRSLHVPGISTTAATATFISWVSGITTWTLKPAAARRLTGVLVGMVAGAFVGDWMLSHAHTYAPVVPVAVIAVVIAIASGMLKQKPAR
ncbi:YoaK family protein [Streptomyces sp. NPDC005808]|uniref:YoaK family protein n=1 Tax=Streptomyces sp. NPDC005808 TaxID=3364734 RepID=UPI0036B436F8